ncbi:GNAT family N-acetyltransferase [Streptomyces sp. TP-A0874]|uniref:GNAT family N-acetyltransferase n=1 Tax=Streptomyces sp. TP-A0874 TaxID=549819 RepID=UPI00099FE4E3|nr:GNAT family N-acetyltransferase [Streptomyces sp. TP-A0874]
MREGAVAGRLVPLVPGYDELGTSLRSPGSRRRRTAYAALDGTGAVLGTLLLELPLQDNEHLAELDINVPPAHPNRGVGAVLCERARQLADESGRTTLLGEVYVPAGETGETWSGARFARKHGFTVENEEDHLALELPASAGQPSAPDSGYSLVSWVGACPEETVAEYARMTSAMEQDVPTGGVDRTPAQWDVGRIREMEQRLEMQGLALVTTAVRGADGEFAGYTQLFVPADNAGEVLQDDTFVLRAHRGHRLGVALKAHNLRLLEREFPDRRRVHTWTGDGNAAMQRINRAFGFAPMERMYEVRRTTG